MKIRTDFVTNSSSSSFIIAYQKTNDQLLNELIDTLIGVEDFCDTEIGKVIRTKYDLDRYFLDNSWGDYKSIEELCVSDDFTKLRYTECIQKLEDGEILLFKIIGYYNDTANKILELLTLYHPHFKVIEAYE